MKIKISDGDGVITVTVDSMEEKEYNGCNGAIFKSKTNPTFNNLFLPNEDFVVVEE